MTSITINRCGVYAVKNINNIFDTINSVPAYCRIEGTKKSLHWYVIHNDDCQSYINKNTKEVWI